MSESVENVPVMVEKPKNRSGGALALFLLFALPMPFCLFIYHFILWSTEQSAIVSSSLAQLAWTGPIGLVAQAFLMSVVFGLLWYFTTDERFKGWYAGLLGASLFAFPALILRTLGANNDQVGAMLQILFALVAALIVMRFRKKEERNWDFGSLPFGLLIAALGFAPLAIFGSFGSLTDIILSLLAGLSFGLLAALLMSDAENLLLNGVGAGAVLALLASAFGYDGAQLILVVLLPAFAFTVGALLPSRASVAAATGLLAFAGLAFFDPTELTIVLGDIGGLATKAVGIALVIGWGVSVVALILRQVMGTVSTSGVKRTVGWLGAGVAWVIVIAAFFVFGHPGFYGDRLFVIFKDQVDISDVANIADRNERLTEAYTRLVDHADQTQADLRQTFDTFGVKYTPYYLENAMEVQGGAFMRLFLMTRSEVDRVIPSPRLRAAPEDSPSPGFESGPPADYVGWNIKMIGADKVWTEFGVRGEGIVVGQSDSGVDGNHPAIAKQYRGYNGSDDYNWFDPWDGTSSPNDEGGHGTHTMGTILGEGGIGVAPEAQWIGCVNLDRNLANPALYLDCMQFMLAPFPIGGDPLRDGDPTKAAHVMNNSWGCPEIEGCDPNALLYAANHLRDAGIFVVVSTGNDGPNCETVYAPLSLYDSVFSVGAIDRSGNLADFSSRGPVTADGSGRIKPDIVAPGVDVFSSLPLNSYGSNSGTSMAGPHLVGVVALIWSAQPELIGDIDATEQLIIDTASPYRGNTSLGCFSGDDPSNAYGYGVVNVYEAVKQALGK
ncbi:MAG: S8 family serine peptidase [Anaerolineales bacterium]|nr:S8 family serine peptidase [Anaerolineales bacterium]